MQRKDSFILDLMSAIRKIDICIYFGFLEIKRRYLGTLLGPFWTTLGLGVFVLTVGIVASGLWGDGLETFILFFCTGIIIWSTLSTIMIESGTMYANGKSAIFDGDFNYMILSVTNVVRNLIVLGHNLVLYVIFCAVFLFMPDPLKLLMIVPGLFIFCLQGIWISVFLGMLTARYKDVQQIVVILTQIAMFITPIFWPPEKLQAMKKVVFVDFNPLYHMIAVVRAPLLGEMPSFENYLANLIILLIGFSITGTMYSLYKRRIIFWL